MLSMLTSFVSPPELSINQPPYLTNARSQAHRVLKKIEKKIVTNINVWATTERFKKQSIFCLCSMSWTLQCTL